jgi:hypothetical protein
MMLDHGAHAPPRSWTRRLAATVRDDAFQGPGPQRHVQQHPQAARAIPRAAQGVEVRPLCTAPCRRLLIGLPFLRLRWFLAHAGLRRTYDSACKDCVTRLLDKHDATRLGSKTGASELKQHKWFAKINWGLLRNTEPPVRRPFICSMCFSRPARWAGHALSGPPACPSVWTPRSLALATPRKKWGCCRSRLARVGAAATSRPFGSSASAVARPRARAIAIRPSLAFPPHSFSFFPLHLARQGRGRSLT